MPQLHKFAQDSDCAMIHVLLEMPIKVVSDRRGQGRARYQAVPCFRLRQSFDHIIALTCTAVQGLTAVCGMQVKLLQGMPGCHAQALLWAGS